MRAVSGLRPAFFVVAFSLSFVACDWKADGPARLEARYGSGDTGDTTVIADAVIPEVDLGDVEGEGLPGRWAMRMVLSGTLLAWDITLSNLFLVDIVEPGQGEVANPSTARLIFCDQLSVIDGSGGIGQAEVPPALREALAEVPLELSLDDAGVAEGELVWTWGLHDLDDSITSSLPDSADDPQVWDQDADGNPGVTMNVIKPAGERYMIRRATWTLSSGALSDDVQSITGTLDFAIEEVALAASSSALMTVAPITPGEGPHLYELRRVGAVGAAGDEDAYDCERLRADHLGLFGAPDSAR